VKLPHKGGMGEKEPREKGKEKNGGKKNKTKAPQNTGNIAMMGNTWVLGNGSRSRPIGNSNRSPTDKKRATIGGKKLQ